MVAKAPRLGQFTTALFSPKRLQDLPQIHPPSTKEGNGLTEKWRNLVKCHLQPGMSVRWTVGSEDIPRSMADILQKFFFCDFLWA